MRSTREALIAMKPMRTIVILLVTAGAVGQLCFASAASASEYEIAGLPELGRCVKAASHNGAFTGAACRTESRGMKGGHEWKPGPGAKPKFTGVMTGTLLETVGKAAVTCVSGEFNGEWTGAKIASVELILKGCTNSASKPCQTSVLTAGEVKTEEAIEGHLGFIRKAVRAKAPWVGFDLTPKEGKTSILKFTCGGPPEEVSLGESWTVSGSVIGRIKPITRMHSTEQLLYDAASGKQSVEKFAEGVKDTLLVARSEGLEKHEEQASLAASTTTFEIHYEEEAEIKAKV